MSKTLKISPPFVVGLMVSLLVGGGHASASPSSATVNGPLHCPRGYISEAGVSYTVHCDSGPGNSYAAYVRCIGNSRDDRGPFVAYSTDPNTGSGVGCTNGSKIDSYGVYTSDGARHHLVSLGG